MEEKDDFNYYQDDINLLRRSLEKLNKKIDQHVENVEKVGENLERVKTELEKHGEKIEKVEKEIEQHGEKIEKVEKEIKQININMSFIFGLFDSLQNIKNNNDENGILNDLEEVEFNDQFKNKEEIKCTICLESYAIGDKISYLPCAHLFHTSCIKNWVRIKNKCPICNNIIEFS